MTDPRPGWNVVLALKPLDQAKTRLSSQLSVGERADLALAMAGDSVRAVLRADGVSRCLVVTADRFAARVLARLGAIRVVEAAPHGLNEAFRLGRQIIVDSGGGPLALMMADLAGCQPTSLSALLDHVPADRAAMVSDIEGVGTTLLACRNPRMVEPRFGPGSRRCHVADGALDLSDLAADDLRRDIDEWSSLISLAQAGPATAAWLRSRELTAIA
ncbi:MAG: 2-phospho-L-lactate/phosphoenolpyruvate guanylyltransferase [Pseudonocardiales bacterium]|jgi:2-phospho-L-lactate guanylyltransferase|nr:2-phospho-L-lactate/phosphoenolpyruvate guanylyltransferase [Pseudonocardiales bacterium]